MAISLRKKYIFILIITLVLIGYYSYFTIENSELFFEYFTPTHISNYTIQEFESTTQEVEDLIPENWTFPLIVGATKFFNDHVLETVILSRRLNECPYTCNYTNERR